MYNIWKNIFHGMLLEPYAEINFGHSITGHKAQGSTFDYVFIDAEDIQLNYTNDEMEKLMYTSCGRVAVELNMVV